METVSTFGKAIARVMKSKMAFHGITQAQAAAAMGISQSQLSKILLGRRTIDLNAFEAFCEALDEKPSDLITEGENIAKKEQEIMPASSTVAAHLIYVQNGQRLPKPINPTEQKKEELEFAHKLFGQTQNSTAQSTPKFPDDWPTLAADHDDNKHEESETPEE